MKKETRIILRWNTQVKTILATFLLLVFSIGAVSGLFIGKAIATKPCTDCEVKAEKIVQTKPTVEPIAISTPTESAPETPAATPTKIYYDCPLSDDLQDYISEQCKDKDLPMPLVIAVIEVESSFKADVISGTNDYGLMQVNKINHERFTEENGITDFLDPYQNVFCGITILSEHYEEYGDIDRALMAYNIGAFGAKRLWDIGIYQTAYTEQIRASMEAYTEG